jgi:hypothetical protein
MILIFPFIDYLLRLSYHWKNAKIQVYPCTKEWYQFLSIGDGQLAPSGALYATIPSHIVKQIHNLGHNQIPHMCLGVAGRGGKDEIDWENKEYKKGQDNFYPNDDNISKSIEPLSQWRGKSMFSTQCSNIAAVIDFAFVPFINDEGETYIEEKTNGVMSDFKIDNTNTSSHKNGRHDQDHSSSTSETVLPSTIDEL